MSASHDTLSFKSKNIQKGGGGLRSNTHYIATQINIFPSTFTFIFRAINRLFYPKQLTIRPFVRRKRNNNVSLSVQ